MVFCENMAKKVILSVVVLIVAFSVVLALLFYSERVSFKNISEFFQGRREQAPLPSASSSPFSSASPALPADAAPAALVASSSVSIKPEAVEEGRELLASMSSYRRGISDAYKEIPVSRSVNAENIWTFLPPPTGFFFTTASSSDAISSYYVRRLSPKWSLTFNREITSGIAQLQFIEKSPVGSAAQEPAKRLNIIIRDKASNLLPAALNLEQGTFVYITFGNPGYFIGNPNR